MSVSPLVAHGNALTGTTECRYDALGRRIAKVANGVETRYIHDGPSDVMEQDASGNALATYVYGRTLDEPISMRRDVVDASGNFTPDGKPEDYYYLLDDQNNVWYFQAVRQGEVVDYAVTPIYEGAAHLPRGIELRATGSGGFNLFVTVLNRE